VRYPLFGYLNDSLSRLRCSDSEGGFGLWLGDNSDIVDGKNEHIHYILTQASFIG
jgi:hypothetical protein